MKLVLRGLLAYLGVLLVLLLVVPLVVPIPPIPDTRPVEELADPDSRFLEVSGLRVHAKIDGQGEPLFVLLHGFGASLFSWREVRSPLSAYGTVLAYDRPAFGLTSRPMPEEWKGSNPYTLESQVDLLISLLDSLGRRQAILVGHSAGGTVATLTALRHPDRVQALVLVGPAIYEGGGLPPLLRPLMATPQARRMGPAILRRLLTDRGSGLIELAWHDSTPVTPEIVAGYTKPTQVEDWDRALWEFMIAGRSTDLAAELDGVKMPVLVITGDDDRIVPAEQSIRLARELPNARLVVIPSCGHLPQEECPEPFLGAVAEFLKTLQ